MSQIDKEEIVRLTEKYGGLWGLNHTRRLASMESLLATFEEETFGCF